MRAVPQHYNDEFKAIDETLLKLYGKRRQLAGSKRMFPPMETLQRWSEELGIETDALSRFLHSMNAHAPTIPFPPETPIGVLPLMKKAHATDCNFLITHALQFDKYSELAIEATFAGEADHKISLRPMLDLVIFGGRSEYETRSLGSSGGGMQAKLRYQVIPRLPEDITDIAISLVPGGYSLHGHAMKEIKLDKQVDFD